MSRATAAIVSIIGVATSLDQQNLAYLLAPVPAGYHDVVLTTDRGDFVQQNVLVHPDGTTTGINFNLADLQQHDIHVVGTATVAGSDDHSNIVVELVETLGGTVVAHVTTGSDGAFVLPATSGVYLVRAHHPDHPLVATLPSVVVHGERDITLTNALVIPVDGEVIEETLKVVGQHLHRGPQLDRRERAALAISPMRIRNSVPISAE